jgi:peroxiredoxin Q/BCP
MEMPAEGEKAPDFTLPDSEGRPVSLHDLSGKTVILYFYPKNDTPGCTKQACSFRDHNPEIMAAGAEVLGVSVDPVKSHGKFREKYDLPFRTLSDEEKSVVEAYGVWKEKQNYGRTYMGVERTTFAIAPDGKVAKVWKRVKPDGHGKQVLDWLSSRKR